MNYKLICIDLDGTLLDNDCQISEKNKAALKAAVDKGIRIAFTTGRMFTSARLHASKAGVNVSIIGSNGAYIREIDGEKAIFECPLDRQGFDKICNVIEKYKLDINFNTFDRVITDYELPPTNNHVLANKTVSEELKIKFGVHKNLREIYDIYEEGLLKVLMFSKDDKETIKKARKELEELGGLEISSSKADNLEIMTKGMTKGTGIRTLAGILGINQEEIMCIGDSENDISMFKAAGLKIAMGNATEELKAMADYVTDTNNNSGVGKAIEKFIL